MALLLWSKFDELSGLVANDSSGNARHGTVYNTNDSAIWQPGIIDGSFNPDGVDDLIVYPVFAFGGSFSISLWIKYTTTATQTPFFKGVWAGGGSRYVYIEVSGGKIRTTSYYSYGTITSPLSCNDGSWHHVVVVIERPPNWHSLYIDNSFIGQVFLENGGGWDPYDLTVARSGNGGGNFLGGVDQLKIFNTALSTGEIANLYYEGHPLVCWNYKARYKNSNRLYTTNGSGKFPSELKVPSSIDISTGCMMDEGKLIDPREYKII